MVRRKTKSRKMKGKKGGRASSRRRKTARRKTARKAVRRPAVKKGRRKAGAKIRDSVTKKRPDLDQDQRAFGKRNKSQIPEKDEETGRTLPSAEGNKLPAEDAKAAAQGHEDEAA